MSVHFLSCKPNKSCWKRTPGTPQEVGEGCHEKRHSIITGSTHGQDHGHGGPAETQGCSLGGAEWA